MNKWADLWESHVKAGKSPEQATALVQAAQAAEQSAPQAPAVQPSSGPTPTKGASTRWGAIQGMFSGGADELAGAAGTVVQKISGDKRPWGDVYKQLQGDAEKGMRRETDANPGYAMAGNAAGAVGAASLTGLGAIPQLVAKTGTTATAIGRIVGGALSGGGAGGVAGALSAEEGERMRGGAQGLVLGTGFGAFGSAGGELLKQGGRAVGLGPAAEGTLLGAIQKRLGMETAEAAGARRAIGTIERSGKSVSKLKAWSDAADPEDIIAEGIGTRGVRALRTTRTLGNTAPERIDDALEDRAANETSALIGKVRKLTGGEARNATVVKESARVKGNELAGPHYRKADDLVARGDEVRAIVQEAADLGDDGVSIWKDARVADGKQFPKTPGRMVTSDAGEKVFEPLDNLTYKQVLRLRQSLDDAIEAGESDKATTLQRASVNRLKELRGRVDAVAKANKDVAEGDRIFAGEMGKAESFGAGEAALLTRSPDELAALRDGARDVGSYRGGVASGLLKKLGSVTDEGGVSNPSLPIFGGQTRRDIARDAFASGDVFESARAAGKNAVKRLKTYRDVSGGSQTVDKAADALDFVTDVGPLRDLANPVGLAEKALTSRVGRALIQQSASEADELSRYLLAGAPGEMSRDAALAALQRISPAIAQRTARQMNLRGAVGGALANGQRDR